MSAAEIASGSWTPKVYHCGSRRRINRTLSCTPVNLREDCERRGCGDGLAVSGFWRRGFEFDGAGDQIVVFCCGDFGGGHGAGVRQGGGAFPPGQKGVLPL